MSRKLKEIEQDVRQLADEAEELTNEDRLYFAMHLNEVASDVISGVIDNG